MSLRNHINSQYIEAFNRLAGKKARRKIVAYVESYDDVLFWSNLLRELETDGYYFEVMLPSRTSLGKGKKVAIANELGPRLGSCMVACVDADYDYLMQGSTQISQVVCQNPYVFHTYAYAIENLQCYAPSLQNVCVMSTLNDRRIFDFETFLRAYSVIVHPLFVWNVWAYRYGHHGRFSLQDFSRIIELPNIDFYHPERTLESLRHRVNAKISRLQKQFPSGRTTYKPLRSQIETLGATPEQTYMYVRGHDLFDNVVAPLLVSICDKLRREREREIKNLACHSTQRQNELGGYQHSIASPVEMLRKHNGYVDAPPYRKIVADVKSFLKKLNSNHSEADAQTAQPSV